MRLSSDQSIIYKKHLKIRFSAYYMLPQIASNEIFLVEIPNATSFLCVKYLTSADVGWSLPLIDKNQKFLKTTHIIYKTYQNSYHLKAWADLKYTNFFFKKFTDQSIKNTLNSGFRVTICYLINAQTRFSC